MGKWTTYGIRTTAIGLCLVLSLFIFAGPVLAGNQGKGKDKEDRQEKVQERLDKILERLCDRLMRLQDRYPWFAFDLPSFCDDEGEEPPELEAPMVDLAANPLSVPVNATTTLSWETEDADVCLASGGWSGSKAFDGSQVVTVAATTTYTLACGNEAGTTTDSVTVGVSSPPPAPVPTLTFTASSTAILAGATTTLGWDSTNATTCTASIGWSGVKPVDGSQVVTPSATTTYTLTCNGAGGGVAKSVTIGVEQPPPAPLLPTVDLNANPLSVLAGGTTTLSWNSEHATVCLASNGWSGSKTLDGSEVVTVSATTTYTLACGNVTGTTTDSVTVGITPPSPAPAPTLDFSASSTTIVSGATSTLSWDSTNADTCTASNGWSGSKSVDGSQAVTPSATTTYTLTCNGTGGGVAKSVTVNVTPAPSGPGGLPDVLITEVYYDVSSTTGAESANEWVEIYNRTTSVLDLSGFTIADGNSSDTLPAGSTIAANGFMVVIASSTTPGFWSIPALATIVNIGSPIGNGLGNDQDSLFLRMGSTTIDALSYGTTTVMNPAIPDVAEGHSIARDPVTTDTNTAADWINRTTPTPGN